MGQTSWITNAEGEEVYVDKGAITEPTPSMQGRKQYAAAEAAAEAEVVVDAEADAAASKASAGDTGLMPNLGYRNRVFIFPLAF